MGKLKKVYDAVYLAQSADGVHSAELCIDFSDYPNGNTVHINKLHKQRFENQWVGKNAVCWIGHDVRVKSYL